MNRGASDEKSFAILDRRTSEGGSNFVAVSHAVVLPARLPQPITSSGSFPPGAPSISRLAVWAQNEELRFFINDQYQFGVKDALLLGGNIGLFARSAGDNAVTVSFSDMVIREITQ